MTASSGLRGRPHTRRRCAGRRDHSTPPETQKIDTRQFDSLRFVGISTDLNAPPPRLPVVVAVDHTRPRWDVWLRSRVARDDQATGSQLHADSRIRDKTRQLPGQDRGGAQVTPSSSLQVIVPADERVHLREQGLGRSGLRQDRRTYGEAEGKEQLASLHRICPPVDGYGVGTSPRDDAAHWAVLEILFYFLPHFGHRNSGMEVSATSSSSCETRISPPPGSRRRTS